MLTVCTVFLDINEHCLIVLYRHVLMDLSMRFGDFSPRPDWPHFRFPIESLVQSPLSPGLFKLFPVCECVIHSDASGTCSFCTIYIFQVKLLFSV